MGPPLNVNPHFWRVDVGLLAGRTADLLLVNLERVTILHIELKLKLARTSGGRVVLMCGETRSALVAQKSNLFAGNV